MKRIVFLLILFCSAASGFAQFADSTQLNKYIRDTVKDRRPDKVTADQIQRALIGSANYLRKYYDDNNFLFNDATLPANRLLNVANRILALRGGTQSQVLLKAANSTDSTLVGVFGGTGKTTGGINSIYNNGNAGVGTGYEGLSYMFSILEANGGGKSSFVKAYPGKVDFTQTDGNYFFNYVTTTTDTTSNKPFVIDGAGRIRKFASWPALGSGGTSYSGSNGITPVGTDFRLGGPLTQNTRFYGASGISTFKFGSIYNSTAIDSFEVNARKEIKFTSSKPIKFNTSDEIQFGGASFGNYFVDTVNYKPLVWGADGTGNMRTAYWPKTVTDNSQIANGAGYATKNEIKDSAQKVFDANPFVFRNSNTSGGVDAIKFISNGAISKRWKSANGNATITQPDDSTLLLTVTLPGGAGVANVSSNISLLDTATTDVPFVTNGTGPVLKDTTDNTFWRLRVVNHSLTIQQLTAGTNNYGFSTNNVSYTSTSGLTASGTVWSGAGSSGVSTKNFTSTSTGYYLATFHTGNQNNVLALDPSTTEQSFGSHAFFCYPDNTGKLATYTGDYSVAGYFSSPTITDGDTYGFKVVSGTVSTVVVHNGTETVCKTYPSALSATVYLHAAIGTGGGVSSPINTPKTTQ